MNRLPNGAIAVGSPGSWMRLQDAYEHEAALYSYSAEEHMNNVCAGRYAADYLLKRAAVSCGIEPTTEAIRAYLIAARKGMEAPCNTK